jgi:hypothetical protein
MKDVLRAGEALAGEVPWNNDSEAEAARHVFSVANNWRDSHAYPMRKIRYELAAQLRKHKFKASMPVARLKRMPSIRRKLKAIPGNLNQMHDLAGCRAILPSIKDVTRFIEAMRANSAHELFREYPYIRDAKADGYRCHHMVYKFRGTGDEEVYNGRRVEVQVRTQLQHSWATAVEAVGLFRREDLKAGRGDPDWLRLFKLMSAEFAVEEGCENADDQRTEEITGLHTETHSGLMGDQLQFLVTVRARINPAGTYSSSMHARLSLAEIVIFCAMFAGDPRFGRTDSPPPSEARPDQGLQWNSHGRPNRKNPARSCTPHVDVSSNIFAPGPKA